jgi:peptide/nickel transport system substrate-binding protein
MKLTRTLVPILLLALIFASLAGCGPKAAPSEPEPPAADTDAPPPEPTDTPVPEVQPTDTAVPPEEPTTLVVAMNIDGIITLDPGYVFEIEPPVILDTTYDPLVETLPGNLNEYSPRLAESWEISDDGLVYTFHLRPGVRFASGNPLTAEDVRFSWMRLLNLKGSGSWYITMLESLEVVDDLTLKATLQYPSPEFLSAIGGCLPVILDSKLVKEHGGTDAEDADTTDTAKEWLDQNSAGSGPYVQTSWVPKSEIVLEKNPYYWREGPNIDRIIIKNVTDPTVALQMLQTGDADLVYMLDKDLAEQVKADPDLVLVEGQMYNFEYIGMTSNPERSEALSNPLVRKAVLLAIDYDGIIDGILNGYAIRAPGMLPLGAAGSNPDMILERDVEQAKSLLAEAGYADGFEVELAYGTSAERDSVAAKIQSDLAELGIDVQLKPLEMSVYFSEARAQNLAFLIGPFATDRMDVANWVPYLSYCDVGLNPRLFYCNPETAKLADLIASEMDPDQRAAYVEEIQQVWIDDAWAQALYQPQQLVAMSKRLQGFQYHPFTLTIFKDLSFSD